MALTRSEIMSRVRGVDTGAEIRLRKGLWAAGLRGYRKNRRDVPGTPDVCWKGRKVAVFVDGCFWHRCPWHYVEPKTNAAYWRPKMARNRARDREVSARLKAEGWVAVRLWEHLPTGKMIRCVRAALIARDGRRLAMRLPCLSRNG